MNDRIARLETIVDHIQSVLKDVRQDVKELQSKLEALERKFDGKFEALRSEMQKSFEELRIGRLMDRVWMLLAMGTLLGVMARGFKWI